MSFSNPPPPPPPTNQNPLLEQLPVQPPPVVVQLQSPIPPRQEENERPVPVLHPYDGHEWILLTSHDVEGSKFRRYSYKCGGRGCQMEKEVYITYLGSGHLSGHDKREKQGRGSRSSAVEDDGGASESSGKRQKIK